MSYELWEFRSRSLLGTYASEREGLAVVHELLCAGWDPKELALGLAQTRPRKQAVATKEPLTGEALAKRAQPGNAASEQPA